MSFVWIVLGVRLGVVCWVIVWFAVLLNCLVECLVNVFFVRICLTGVLMVWLLWLVVHFLGVCWCFIVFT